MEHRKPTSRLKDFSLFLKEELQNPEFAKGFEEERAKLRFALFVKELRKKWGLTQKQLAVLAETDQPSITRVEQALILPKFELLSRIAMALGGHLHTQFPMLKQLSLNLTISLVPLFWNHGTLDPVLKRQPNQI